MKIVLWLYRILGSYIYLILLPSILILRQLFTGKKHGNLAYKLALNIPDNIQALQNINKQTIWIHAVSYGEVKTLDKFIKQLHLQYPDYIICLSTTTDTGYELAINSYKNINYLEVFQMPFDWYYCIKKYLNIIRPSIVIIAETELWPEFLYQASNNNNTQTYIINGRITESSAKLYKLPIINNLLKISLNNITAVIAQSQIYANRFINIGVPDNSVYILPSLKFSNFQLTKPEIHNLSVIHLVAGSTHQGEEILIHKVYKYLQEYYKNHTVQLTIIPRHITRVSNINRELDLINNPDNNCHIIDKMGMSNELYKTATLVYLGGTWANIGGHNPLEPLSWYKDVICGQYTHKLSGLIEILEKNNLIYIKQDLDNIIQCSIKLINTQITSTENIHNAQFEVLNNYINVSDDILNIISKTTKI